MPAIGYRKPDGDRRTCAVKSYLTTQEYAQFSERAKACGMTKAALMRALMVGESPRAKPTRISSEVIHHLGKIGTNLNQLARHANAGRYPSEPILKATLDQITSTITRLNDPTE